MKVRWAERMKYSHERPGSYRGENRRQGRDSECHINVIASLGLALIGAGCGGAEESKGSPDCAAIEAVTSWESGVFRHDRPGCASLDLSATVLGTDGLSVEFVAIDGGWQPEVIAETAGRFDGLVLSGSHSLAG